MAETGLISDVEDDDDARNVSTKPQRKPRKARNQQKDNVIDLDM